MGEQEIRAFALAPLPWLVPLLLAAGVKAVVGDTGDAGYAGVFFAMLALALLSYVPILLIGVPIHLVLQRFQKTRLIYYVSLAVLPFVLLAGTIAVWAQLAPAQVPPGNPFSVLANAGDAIKWTLAFAAIAALSATTFWYARVRQRKS